MDGSSVTSAGLKTARDATGSCYVIRGEETQVIGALARLGDPADATLILPGTHTKWLRVADGEIADFATVMTGELHAALLDATILGDPVRSADAAGVADNESNAEASDSGVAHSLSHPGQPFAARLQRPHPISLR
ncbi:2-dehydro-3-deoxygalactonokinase [Arthrobacter sp. 2MCAF15]|uniref:2-dehydro-3-deoxygalactonokinase n=1 Tax=Arthrobacter sp. 2MCAF15 TaxID=3232984 RepID=UPI003F933EEF